MQDLCDRADLSNIEASSLTAAENAHDSLVEMGGRPTRNVQREPGRWQRTVEGQKDLWPVRHYSMEGARFRTELERWRLFREYQRIIRLDISTFVKSLHNIDKYWQQNLIPYDLKPQLHIDPQKQTKIEEWKEFWFQQFQMRAPKSREVWKARGQAHSVLQIESTETPRYKIRSAGNRWISMASDDLEKWDKWLVWIAKQLPTIVSEYALSKSPSDDKDSPDPLIHLRSTHHGRTGPGHRIPGRSSRNKGAAGRKNVPRPHIGIRRSTRIAKRQKVV